MDLQVAEDCRLRVLNRTLGDTLELRVGVLGVAVVGWECSLICRRGIDCSDFMLV